MPRRRVQQSKRRRQQRPKFKQIQKKFVARCWCGKIIFPDEITADMALTRGVGRKGSIRSYECTVIPGNWHTTSQDFRPGQQDEESRQDEK